MGDFGDLKAMLVVWQNVAAYIGLNPIHALYRQFRRVQPIQPVFSPLAECDLYDNALKISILAKRLRAWWQLPTTQQTVATGARCRLGSILHGYRPKNDSITNGVERFRAT
ncbi:hypothetical protein ACNKHL_20670 [Shigella flexneri]